MSRSFHPSNVIWFNILKGAFGSLIAGKHPSDGAGAIMDLLHALENIEHISSQRSDLAAAAQSAIITDYHATVAIEDLPLWIEQEQEEHHNPQKDVFAERLSKSQKWHFFRDWYLGMWNGTWADWDLAHEVAKIEAEVWEGADALAQVAARIDEIRKRFERDLPRTDSVPELDRKKLITHVKKLLASPEMTALVAEGAAETLTRAIRRYFDDAPANSLPDALEHLHDLPKLFMTISATVKSKERAEAKEQRLADQIEALNAQLAYLEAKLKEANGKTVNGLFTQSALKAAGAAFGAGTIGSLGLAINHFFGQWPDDLTLENLRNWLSSLESTVPKSEAQTTLPLTSDV